jgi:peptidoglycan/xylan/chitin deacetylase (PgdA/CDA1 family)
LITDIFINSLVPKFIKGVIHKPIIFPFYHSVDDRVPLHIKHLYPVKTKTEFIQDIEYLLKNFTVMAPSDLYEENDTVKYSKPGFILSFDDGLRSCYDTVAPILEQMGVPAIFFVNSSFVDNKALFYRFKTSILIERIKAKSFSENTYNELFKLLDCRTMDQVITALLKTPYENENILDEAAKLLDIDFEDYLKQTKPFMTTLELKNLADKGFTIGAHSHTHPLYKNLNKTMQMEESRLSIDFVKQHFNPEALLFSFPFTDDRVRMEVLKQLQQELKISASFGTAGIKNERLKNHYQRIPMDKDSSPASITIVKAALKSAIRSTLGINTIKRD